jgi:hypothetical protein
MNGSEKNIKRIVDKIQAKPPLGVGVSDDGIFCNKI